MPKKAMKVPAARNGRGVRWTLEVTANVDEAAKTSSGRGPAEREGKRSRGKRNGSHAESAASHAEPGSRARRLKSRRRRPAASRAATIHVVTAPAPAIVAPAVILPQSPGPVVSASDSSPAWPTDAVWQHPGVATSEADQANASTSAPHNAETLGGRDPLAATSAATVQAGPMVNDQLVSRPLAHGRSRAGHQNAVKMVAAAVIAVAIVTALALTRDPSARSSVALSAAGAAPAVEASSLESQLPAPRQVGRESQNTEPIAPSAAAGAPVRTQTVVTEKPKVIRDARVTTPAGSAPVSAVIPSVAQPPVAAVSEASIAKPVTAETNAASIALEPARSPDAQAVVTITGCLETDGERFRLTETDGADAPKARGWRSGFLKKRPAAVELVAYSDAVALRKYVGHRVAATGPLESRALQVRSFRPSSTMCD